MEDEIRKLFEDEEDAENLETIPRTECQAFEHHDFSDSPPDSEPRSHSKERRHSGRRAGGAPGDDRNVALPWRARYFAV